MHGHVSKHDKMHRNPMGGTNKHGKHIITRREKGKGMDEATSIMVMHPKWLQPKGLTGVECNHTTTNPLRASSVAKPRTREANIEDKA